MEEKGLSMKYYLPCAVFYGALVFAAGISAVSAQPVERSGNTFHRVACPRKVSPQTVRCHAHIVTDEKGNPLERPDKGNVHGGGSPAGYSATSLQTAYGINPTKGSSATIIAIVDAYGYSNAESDLATYRQTMGLAPCTSSNGCFTKYNQSGAKGNYPAQNTGWAQETALDLDMASAMCPKCKIILVESNTASLSDLASAVNTAASLGAHVISNSYGTTSEGDSLPYEAAYNHSGIAITASSGDNGYGVQFPASSPHVIGVGGTSLYLSPTRSETAWSGAGSGCSTAYPKPSWQTDPLCTNRMVADVAAVADPATGVAVYAPSSFGIRSAWQVYGGTSVAAPLIGGIFGNNGGSVNYGSNPYSGAAGLNDVNQGSNGTCGGTYFCASGAGYDGPTGLGTPKGNSAF
jgi:subtilase family serine protease